MSPIPPGADLLRPLALWLLAFVPLGTALTVFAWRRRRRALAAFAGPGARLVARSGLIGAVKAGLALAALASLVLAAAGPRIGVTERPVLQHGVDLVIALDVSQSMAVKDVAPDRLHAARDAIASLAGELEGSRVALVLFAGNAVARYPATTDIGAITSALDNSSRAFRPAGGSSLRSGIEASLSAFPSAGESRRRAVLVISDGGDAGGDMPDPAVIRARGVRLYALGVGTTAGGQIPTYDVAGTSTGVLRGTNGQPIVSALEEPGLRDLAERGGGKYWRFSGGDAPLRDLISELRTMDASTVGEEKVPADRFQWFVALALALLLLDLLLDDRRPMPAPALLAIDAAPRRLAPGSAR